MRFAKLITPAALLLISLVLFQCPTIIGQVLQPALGTRSFELIGHKSKPQSFKANEKSDDPYQLSSRIHIQKGSQKGYLVVKIELPKGSYVYSMSQAAPLRPTKIKVSPSKMFRLKGDFSPDRPAKIIKNDPVFKQKLEKHLDVIQFFAPIEIVAGTDPKKLTAEASLNGQVCTDDGFCMPIFDVKTKAKFAGYFERSAKKRVSSQFEPKKRK